jgi:23S rRNA (cytosine1962-C5)-methyltransferase
MAPFAPVPWPEYELIDTGNLEKLERFGKYILARPEPQAIWKKALPETEWEKLSHARYKRARGIDPATQEYAEKGEWTRKPGMPDQWYISYSYRDMRIKFRLGLTSFGHIGVFPEQAGNWNFIYDCILSHNPESLTSREGGEEKRYRVLNLFAYTGGSSLAAKAAGADIVHVDSVKNVINWSKGNMEASSLKDIRWVVEDALKFVRREARRGNRYNGIILDPPAYGRGPEGEKWILQEAIDEMITLCKQILSPAPSFFVLSLYSMGFSPMVADSLVRTHFGSALESEYGEFYFTDRAGRNLPLGIVLRFQEKV